jgi:hypothetical protein
LFSMDKPMSLEQTMQWLNYRMARSNAIWFCKQSPAKTENVECTAKDLKTNTEKWIKEAIERWQNLVKAQHPDALRVMELLTGKWMTKEENTISAKIANNSGHPEKCLCPDCMIEEIVVKQNPELKLSIPKVSEGETV